MCLTALGNGGIRVSGGAARDIGCAQKKIHYKSIFRGIMMKFSQNDYEMLTNVTMCLRERQH